jgi:thioredoxin-like negative regulator of GroEL
VPGGTAVLTKYGTEWCPACKELAGVLDKIGPRYEGSLKISIVDLEKDSSDVTAISKLGFQGLIPFMVLKSSSGEVLWSGMGYVPEDKLVQILSQKGITGKH